MSASPVVVLVTKSDPAAVLGIGMKGVGSKLVVSSIDEGGLFYESDLKVGMTVDSINGTKFAGTELSDAIGALKSAEGQVTLVAYPAVATATAVAVKTAAGGAADPPPGVSAGGQWGTNVYVGGKTQAAACVGCLCFCLPGLCILCCPFDERDAYKVGGRVYLADGQTLPADAKFEPKRNVMQR